MPCNLTRPRRVLSFPAALGRHKSHLGIHRRFPHARGGNHAPLSESLAQRFTPKSRAAPLRAVPSRTCSGSGNTPRPRSCKSRSGRRVRRPQHPLRAVPTRGAASWTRRADPKPRESRHTDLEPACALDQRRASPSRAIRLPCIDGCWVVFVRPTTVPTASRTHLDLDRLCSPAFVHRCSLVHHAARSPPLTARASPPDPPDFVRRPSLPTTASIRCSGDVPAADARIAQNRTRESAGFRAAARLAPVAEPNTGWAAILEQCGTKAERTTWRCQRPRRLALLKELKSKPFMIMGKSLDSGIGASPLASLDLFLEYRSLCSIIHHLFTTLDARPPVFIAAQPALVAVFVALVAARHAHSWTTAPALLTPSPTTGLVHRRSIRPLPPLSTFVTLYCAMRSVKTYIDNSKELFAEKHLVLDRNVDPTKPVLETEDDYDDPPEKEETVFAGENNVDGDANADDESDEDDEEDHSNDSKSVIRYGQYLWPQKLLGGIFNNPAYSHTQAFDAAGLQLVGQFFHPRKIILDLKNCVLEVCIISVFVVSYRY
ncbi:hypothetical protein B0H15DRAFT_956309 [Mycena belliarum]|uniref:Uncharacterized protein n=1 Tax=Mycena belliarum TaxID=1033014 RepID=A0AAD6TRZ5_9AGAR|nr:hypothetical protein B0H15DRAFT_956309 [Mycena belliae]